MGVRAADTRPQLSPIASKKDVGRRPLRKAGRVSIELVVPDPQQPRTEFADEAIERLAASIREKGQLLPIHVRWSTELEQWLIISGERRWRATRRAGLQTIDCYFHEASLADSEVLEQQLIENLLREDLKPIEEARAFSTLMELNGWNGKELATGLHVSASRVSRALALLDLPEEIQSRVEAGELAARSAYELSKLKNTDSQHRLAEEAVDGGMTSSEAAREVRRLRSRKATRPRGTSLHFASESGWKISAKKSSNGSYDELAEALEEVLEEVRHRIKNRVSLN